MGVLRSLLLLTATLFSILTHSNAQDKCNSCSNDNGKDKIWGIGGGEVIASPNANKSYLFYVEYFPSEPFCTSYGNKSYWEVWRSKIEPAIIAAIKQHHLFKKAVDEGFEEGHVYELDGLLPSGGIVDKNFFQTRINDRTEVVKLDIDIKQYINDFKSCSSFKNGNTHQKELSQNEVTNDSKKDKTESDYVYLKSPLQLLNEAENELLTLSDPLERQQKKEQISFLRQSSIDVARANGDQVTSTRLQIEQDNQNWANFSESAGQLIGGLIVNAAEKREARRSQEYRSMMEKEKRFIEFPKYLNNIKSDNYQQLRKLNKVFQKYPASSVEEQKQRILQFLLAGGNALIGTKTNSSKSNRDGLCMYLAQQSIQNAYFKGNTLHIEFTREVKQARFDHPVRVLGKRGYDKLKYYDIKKYILTVKASYDYHTKVENVALEIDWGLAKEKYSSVEKYKKYRTDSYPEGSFFNGTKDGTKEFLLDYMESFVNPYNHTGFMDILVMPKLMDEFNKSLSNSIVILNAAGDADQLFSIAFTYYNNGDYNKTVEFFEKSSELGHEDATFNLGVLHQQGTYIDKNDDLAKKYYLKALAINPDNVGANQNMAILLLSQENSLVEQMNNNLDNYEEYNRLANLRLALFKDVLPYLEKAYELSLDEEIKNRIEVIESELSKS